MLGDASSDLIIKWAWLSLKREWSKCVFHAWILSRRDACSLLLLHACVSRKSGGGGSLWSSLARFTCALISKFHRLTGAEGELQLRPLLSAGEWKSREIPGRGTPSRRLSFQWTRWISGGKKTCSLHSFYFFKSFLPIYDLSHSPRIDHANSVRY